MAGPSQPHKGSPVAILAAGADPASECSGLMVMVACQALPSGAARGGLSLAALAGTPLWRLRMLPFQLGQQSAVDHGTELAS